MPLLVLRHSCALFRALSIAVAAMLIVGLGWLTASPAAAQDDEFADEGVSGDSYESPTFGYSLSWDDRIWTVRDADSAEDGDYLRLRSGVSDLYLESFFRFAGDPADCLSNAIATIEDDERVSDFAPLLDDDGEPIAGDDEAGAFAAYTYTYTSGGDERDMAQRFECRVLVEDEAVLQIDHLAPADDFADESERVADVLATLDIPGAPTASTDEAASDSENADDEEPTTDDAADADSTDDPPAEDEESAGDAEDTDAPQADDEEPDDAIDPADLDGVDGDGYTSPTYDYTLEWDADLWSPTLATSEDDVDTLVLDNDVTSLTIVGTAEFGENLDRCVRSARRALEAQDGVADLTPTLDADDEPIEIDEDDRAGALYTVEASDEDAPNQIAQIECRPAVAGEASIQIVVLTPTREFNDQIEPVTEVLDSIALADDGAADDPAPDDDESGNEDDNADNTDETAVDGNTYVSPNFGYTIEWDEDVWTFDDSDDSSENSEPGFDSLFIESDNSGLAVIGSELPDPETCVTEFSSFLRSDSGSDIDDWAPLEDEDGERVEGERDGGYFAAFSLTVTQQGQDFDLVYYFECRTVVEGQSVVLFFLTTSPAAYDDAVDELSDLLDTLVLPDEDATDAPASDDADDAEVPADDDDQPADDSDSDSTADADLDTYTDPDFPFVVTWNERDWTVSDQRTVGEGHNLLTLTAEDGGELTIEGWGRWDGVPDDCLNDLTLNLRAVEGVEDFSRVRDTDLYPETSSPGSAYALYSYTLAPEGRTPIDYVVYLECRTVVDGEAVIVFTLVVPADGYEAVRPLVEPILADIEIEG